METGYSHVDQTRAVAAVFQRMPSRDVAVTSPQMAHPGRFVCYRPFKYRVLPTRSVTPILSK